MKKVLLISILLFLMDIFTKQMVLCYLVEGQRIELISNFFSITYVKNTGVAFSLLEGNLGLIIGMTLVIIIVIFSCLKDSVKGWRECIGYGLILGGAFGNLLDRVFYGYVIDFLDFDIWGYSFPIFNVADCGIVIGVVLLIVANVLESRGRDDYKGRKKCTN